MADATFLGIRRRVPVPKDEAQEERERQRAQRLIDIALQQLEWAHQRVDEEMGANHLEAADAHSMTAALWWEKLTSG